MTQQAGSSSLCYSLMSVYRPKWHMFSNTVCGKRPGLLTSTPFIILWFFEYSRHASPLIVQQFVAFYCSSCYVILLSHDIMALNISLMFLLARIRVVVIVAVFLSVFRPSAQQGTHIGLIIVHYLQIISIAALPPSELAHSKTLEQIHVQMN